MARQCEGCSECKFHHVDITWTAPLDFNYSPKFLFVMDQYYPSAKGRLLQLLRSCDFDTSNVEAAFLTRCWAGEGTKAQIKEGQKCFPLFADLLSKVSPDTIVIPMGASPCKVVAGAKSITTAHGTVIERDGRLYIPTLHPGQVIAYPDSLSTFTADLQKIEDAGNGKIVKKSDVDYTWVKTINDFRTMLLELWMSPDYSVDIESSSLDPHRTSKNPWKKPDQIIYDPKVLCFTFTTKSHTAWFLPLDHPESTWSKKERAYILKGLKTLLEAKDRGVQILHGGDFDYRYIKHVLDITLGRYTFDTLLAHYTAVTEEKGTHYLKILAWEFTDMGGYDDGLEAYKLEHPECNPDKGGSYQNIPLQVLFGYACGDSDCTYRLYEVFKPLVEDKFQDLYYKIIVPANIALADIENEGAPIDLEYWRYCCVEYPRIMDELLTEMRQYSEVLEVERAVNHAHKVKKAKERKKRFQERLKKLEIIRELEPDKYDRGMTRLRVDIEKAKQTPIVVKPVTFNPKSTPQKQHLLFTVLGFKPTKRGKGGGWSTDKEVLKTLWLDNGHPLLKAIGKWTKAKTLYSMFIEKLPEMLGDDGRLRGSYNLAGTETGRLSCSNPNLQQIPRNLVDDEFLDIKLPNVKKLFKAPKGFYLMQFDYSQAELRILAALSREPMFLDAFAKDQDIHMRTASQLFERWTYDEMIALSELREPTSEEKALMKIVKEQRQGAKTINFGLLYGQGAKKLARTMGWTEQKAKDFIKLYFKKLTRIRAWIKKMKTLVRQDGFIMSPYGRMRRLATAFSPEQDIVAKAERQAVNSPIQATASDCMLLSLAKANRYMRVRGMLSRIIITVHDSAIVLVHESEVEQVYLIMKKIMENPPHDGWLTGIIMKADAEVGINWAELKKLKSVKDVEPKIQELMAA